MLIALKVKLVWLESSQTLVCILISFKVQVEAATHLASFVRLDFCQHSVVAVGQIPRLSIVFPCPVVQSVNFSSTVSCSDWHCDSHAL